VGTRYFGASVARVEDPRLLRGSGRFVDDIKLPGLLHAALVRSPHAHARITAVQLEAARALPGVAGVFGYEDLAAWIKMGAPWPGEATQNTVAKVSAFNLEERRRQHWSWKPIQHERPPSVKDTTWPAGPVDHFLLSKFELKGQGRVFSFEPVESVTPGLTYEIDVVQRL